MALYLSQNFVSTQYLENQMVEFHQIVYMLSSWQDLAWDRYTSFFANFYQSYDHCLVLVQPRKTRPDITERLLTGT